MKQRKPLVAWAVVCDHETVNSVIDWSKKKAKERWCEVDIFYSHCDRLVKLVEVPVKKKARKK